MAAPRLPSVEYQLMQTSRIDCLVFFCEPTSTNSLPSQPSQVSRGQYSRIFKIKILLAVFHEVLPNKQYLANGTCHFDKCELSANVFICCVINTNENDEAMKVAVATLGPLATSVDANSTEFKHYKGVVFDNPSCGSVDINHSVLVVGYGSDGRQDYWIVKNSYGTSWEEDGYILMSRNKGNQCGIATLPVYLKRHKEATEAKGLREQRSHVWSNRCEQRVPGSRGAPEYLDLRKQGFVIPVKDQVEQIPCCRATSLPAITWFPGCGRIGALEGQVFATYSRLISFPEQQLIDCSNETIGCEDGDEKHVLEYMLKAPGIQNDVTYPYEATQNTTLSCPFPLPDKSLAHTNIFTAGISRHINFSTLSLFSRETNGHQLISHSGTVRHEKHKPSAHHPKHPILKLCDFSSQPKQTPKPKLKFPSPAIITGTLKPTQLER
ncbi:cathepsin l [Plakobranchus ocellatus]|uniref:Cathepsin l n=1 Tax=Plakobranchus ocellatus TaxID=259542 RepID=A0AAV4DT14_9GAST|nr:cathepsin l [Plakobranchus ocellatus]